MRLPCGPNLDFQQEVTSSIVELFQGEETCRTLWRRVSYLEVSESQEQKAVFSTETPRNSL